MAYNNIEYGFRVGNASLIDDRLVLSKADMRAVSDVRMPDKYFALCSDDNCIYVYSKLNEKQTGSNDTGRFRLYTTAEDVDLPVVDVLMNLKDNKFESIVEDKKAKINLPFTIKDGKICAIFEG